ncbi:MAG TPA: endolytic transglycosylase MltG [Candidatus Acidoferrales bacterium]|nr:endolytic transglycosylase MltG [Candidatus Acidoferrales bacterium]
MTRSRVAGAFIVAGFLLVFGALAAWFVTVFMDRALPTENTQVVVPRGSTLADIAELLQSHGVIVNALAFRVLARVQHEDAEVRAGAYAFAPHTTAAQILNQLVTGGAQVATWVTIPEGFTAAQIAARLQAEGVGRAADFRRSFRGHEGYLFPSTYLIPLAATPEQVTRMLTDQFSKELPSDARQRARALHVTIAQAVTVASLVEREAKVEADRPMIAAVIYNRLRLGMPLQVDATIEYALPEYKTQLSYHDLRINSPYNTYEHPGLPPTPIANPGLPSLEAALDPAKTDALYYVYCGNGHHVFAKTFAEHQANVARCLH